MAQQIKTSVPTIKGLPLIGNLIDFRYNRLPLLQKVSEECGDIGKFHVGPTEVILLNTPRYIHKALIEHAYLFRKPGAMTSLVRPVIGNGLYIAEGDEHKQRRKQLAPLFQHQYIAHYDNIVTKYTEQARKSWNSDDIIDITSEMMKITLNIISDLLFNKDMSPDFNNVRVNLNIIVNHINKTISSLIPISTAYPTRQNHNFKTAIHYIETIIQKAIKEQTQSNTDNTNMLSMLLQTGMTDKQIRDEIMSIFIAGHEMTALAATWSWYLLTKHPNIYKEMRNEIDTVLKGRKPTHKDLPKLPMTLRIIKESMRLYPPSYLLARKAICDVQLEDYHIPSGRVIAISPYTLHRRSKYFDNPNTFNPSRFENEDQNQAYMPFGIGPRTCLSNHLAMLEAQIILITITQTTTFELVQGQNIIPQPLITLYPNQAIKMTIRHH
jgi:cytochrome P450